MTFPVRSRFWSVSLTTTGEIVPRMHPGMKKMIVVTVKIRHMSENGKLYAATRLVRGIMATAAAAGQKEQPAQCLPGREAVCQLPADVGADADARQDDADDARPGVEGDAHKGRQDAAGHHLDDERAETGDKGDDICFNKTHGSDSLRKTFLRAMTPSIVRGLETSLSSGIPKKAVEKRRLIGYTICIVMRVLVIEDEAKVASFISKGLEEEAMRWRWSTTAGTAWNSEGGPLRHSAPRPDDPRDHGLEVLKTIRERGVNTPVLIITAKSSKEDVVRGLDTGSDDYLTKPFSFDELLARIRALLEEGSRPKHPRVRYKDYVRTPSTGRCPSGPRRWNYREGIHDHGDARSRTARARVPAGDR